MSSGDDFARRPRFRPGDPTASGAPPSDPPDFGAATLHGRSGPVSESGARAGGLPTVQRQPSSVALPPELDPNRGRRRAPAAEPPGNAAAPNYTNPAAPNQSFASQSTREGRRSQRPERGLLGWQALLVLLVICGIGGLIDVFQGSNVRGAFNIAIVVASLVAILVVRRSGMFPIVVAPPLVYLAASATILFVRGGLSNRTALYNEAANWLVYGFPAIAGATAAVLLVAGIRMIVGR